MSDKAKAVENLAREDLSFWLAILATSMANQKRFHVLELARVNQEQPDDAEIRREIIAKHNEATGSNVLRAVHRLSDALQRDGELDDPARIFLPLQASGIVETVNKARGQIGQFVNVTSVGPLSWAEARDRAATWNSHARPSLGTVPSAYRTIKPVQAKIARTACYRGMAGGAMVLRTK